MKKRNRLICAAVLIGTWLAFGGCMVNPVMLRELKAPQPYDPRLRTDSDRGFLDVWPRSGWQKFLPRFGEFSELHAVVFEGGEAVSLQMTNPATGEIIYGMQPFVSPDGTKIAFFYSEPLEPRLTSGDQAWSVPMVRGGLSFPRNISSNTAILNGPPTEAGFGVGPHGLFWKHGTRHRQRKRLRS